MGFFGVLRSDFLVFRSGRSPGILLITAVCPGCYCGQAHVHLNHGPVVPLCQKGSELESL